MHAIVGDDIGARRKVGVAPERFQEAAERCVLRSRAHRLERRRHRLKVSARCDHVACAPGIAPGDGPSVHSAQNATVSGNTGASARLDAGSSRAKVRSEVFVDMSFALRGAPCGDDAHLTGEPTPHHPEP